MPPKIAGDGDGHKAKPILCSSPHRPNHVAGPSKTRSKRIVKSGLQSKFVYRKRLVNMVHNLMHLKTPSSIYFLTVKLFHTNILHTLIT